MFRKLCLVVFMDFVLRALRVILEWSGLPIDWLSQPKDLLIAVVLESVRHAASSYDSDGPLQAISYL